MSKILAIDTTGERMSLALGDGAQVWRAQSSKARAHDERLFPELRKLLKRAGWSLKDLDVIAVVNGPGRFTGIRIGMTFAGILGKIIQRPALAISHLEILAHRVLASGGERINHAVYVVLESGNDFYLQDFAGRPGQINARAEAIWGKTADLALTLRGLPAKSRVLKYRSENLGDAENLIPIALERLARKKFESLNPLYLKPANFQLLPIRSKSS